MPPSPARRASAVTQGALVASAAVLGSRLLGLVREQTFAALFGASAAYDAFVTAFRIPNLLRDLLAEGALSLAFTAVFSRVLAERGRPAAFAVASGVLTALLGVVGTLAAVGMVAAGPLVAVFAAGFPPAQAALAAQLTCILAPFIVMVSAAAVLMGMLNALGRFGLPQSASTAFNAVSIVVGVALAWALAPDYLAGSWRPGAAAAAAASGGAGHAMVGMALGTLAGGLAQCLVQVPAVVREGFRWRPRASWRDPELREVLRLMGPAAVGAAAVQVNVFVNSNLASRLGEGAIGSLAYAFRLMQFPIGVFGVAVMSAALPALARQGGAGGEAAFGRTLTEALEMVAFLCLPAALGLILLGEPLVALIYQRGRFAAADTRACALALSAYAAGLPAYAGVKLMQPAHMARGDARLPMLVSLAAVALGIGCNLALVFGLHVGPVGLAATTSLVAWFNLVALVVALERRRRTLARRQIAWELARVAACTLAAATAMAAARALPGGPAVQVPLGVSASAAVYLAAAAALRVRVAGEVLALARRRLLRR